MFKVGDVVYLNKNYYQEVVTNRYKFNDKMLDLAKAKTKFNITQLYPYIKISNNVHVFAVEPKWIKHELKIKIKNILNR